MLETRLITTGTELAALEMPWNILAAGHPLRSWNWLATWWKHYGDAGRRLHVLAVYDNAENEDGTLVGLAPWYMEHTAVHGNVVRPLGDGEVCTDHLSLLCQPGYVATVVTTLADYLIANDDEWGRLELVAIDEGDEAIELLVGELESRDALVSGQRAGNCWVIDLPETWDEYVADLSPSHRRQLRKCQRSQVESGRSRWHQVTQHSELAEAWSVLVNLHQRRRNTLGEAGCFASRQFRDFHREVIEQLFSLGQLRMSWLELDAAPFTAEYHVSSPETVFTYQSGIDTARLAESPGRLAYMLTIQRAIKDGFIRLDFLRGDEAYKAHFRATARPTYDYLVFPNRRLARLRGHVVLAAESLKDWVKQSVAPAKS